jgi:hypothetical protein
MDRRLRQHAHDIRVALPMIDYVAENFPDGAAGRFGDIDAAVAAGIGTVGRDLADTLEAGASMQLPSPRELREWQRAGRAVIRVAKALWPEVVADYIDGLDSRKDKRLMGSM